MLVELFKQVF